MPRTLSLEARVRHLVAEASGRWSHEIDAFTPFASLGLDSLDHAELVMDVEEQFDIMIADDDWAGLQSIHSVLTYLRARGLE